MHWAAAYIGLPWEATANGPRAYNCWSFVRHVQKAHFGLDLPEIPNPEDLRLLAESFRDHPERARWKNVGLPQEGDCVLLRMSRVPIHVGVWLCEMGGGVLHCARGAGVVYQRLDALDLNGWKIAGFYRFKGGQREG